MVAVDASVLRRGLVREDLVEGHVVMVHTVAGWEQIDDRRRHAQVAQQRVDRDVHHIVAKASAIGPTARDRAASETDLNCAGQSVATKDAQTREPGIIRIGARGGPVARQSAWTRGEIHFD